MHPKIMHAFNQSGAATTDHRRNDKPGSYAGPVDQREREFYERLMATALGEPVAITDAVGLGRSDFAQVWRVWLDQDVSGLGRSVIVKTRRAGGSGWGYDLGNLRREYAALATLSALGLDIAPRVVMADDQAGVLVLTDLGSGPTIEQLLMGHDPLCAEKALLSAADLLATLHRDTAPAEPEFVARYSALAGGETPDVRPIPSLETPLARCPQLCEDLAELGLPAPAADLASLTATLADPAARTLTHTDLNPSNFVVVGDRVVLVDYEGAGYRHVGLDLMFLRFPFQNHGLRLPTRVMQSIEQAYRATLPASEEAVALGCVLLLIEVCYSIRTADDAEQTAESARRRRARIWELLAASLNAVDQAGIVPGVARWLCALADALYARWPEVREPTPLFPVFR